MQIAESLAKSQVRGPVAKLTILGAGPAGLACAYFARKNQITATTFEASEHIGGNCRTLRYGDFLFDTGAHRFHDRFPEITNEIKGLLGNDLFDINIPSQIVYDNRLVDFPLSPLNLLRNLGPRTSIEAVYDFVAARFHSDVDKSFESIAVKNYGRTLAKAFLLDYSEKLWGVPASNLSPSVSGRRLKGLKLSTFLVEALHGSRSKTTHLDGRFLYPRLGIGMIMDKLADTSGRDNIQMNSRVTGIFHSENRIHSIEINGRKGFAVENIVSTLPLSILLRILDPAPPEHILELAQKIRFQNLVLVALFLNRDQITPNASLYFPDKETIFTRAYEPKNRSSFMAPEDKTSLIVEIPCHSHHPHWTTDDPELVDKVVSQLTKLNLIRSDEIMDSAVHRIPFAYPVLELGIESVVQEIMDYLSNFQNLKTSGRSGRFAYTHIHDLMESGRQLIQEFVALRFPSSIPQTNPK